MRPTPALNIRKIHYLRTSVGDASGADGGRIELTSALVVNPGRDWAGVLID
jgi:hypothetical protein